MGTICPNCGIHAYFANIDVLDAIRQAANRLTAFQHAYSFSLN